MRRSVDDLFWKAIRLSLETFTLGQRLEKKSVVSGALQLHTEKSRMSRDVAGLALVPAHVPFWWTDKCTGNNASNSYFPLHIATAPVPTPPGFNQLEWL